MFIPLLSVHGSSAALTTRTGFLLLVWVVRVMILERYKL